jgi:hypothetical protein
MMAFKLLGSFTMLLLSIILLPLAYAQTTSSLTSFSTKGEVYENSNFHGIIMWTIMHGNEGTIIIQSPVGRSMTHVSIYPSVACISSVQICLFSNVTDTINNDVFKMGDTARFSIDLSAKQETISLLTGTLAGSDVTVNLSKTWAANQLSNNVSVISTASKNINSIVTSNSSTGRHFSVSLNESMNFTVK